MDPERSPGLGDFELAVQGGQLTVKCIPMTNIIVEIKKFEPFEGEERSTDAQLRKAATELLRSHRNKPNSKLGKVTDASKGKKWQPVATSVAEVEFLLTIVKLNDQVKHDFLSKWRHTITSTLPFVSPIPEIASMFPSQAGASKTSSEEPSSPNSDDHEPLVTVEILAECGFPNPQQVSGHNQEFTALCSSLEETLECINALSLVQ